MDDLYAGKITIKTTVKVPCEYISDMLTTAFESGGNWITGEVVALAATGDYLYAEDELAYENKVLRIPVDGETHTLTRPKYLHGLEKYCNIHSMTVEDVYELHDAGTADLILQYALFGEEVYA